MANVKRRFVRQYPPEVSMCAGCNSCEAVCSLLHDGVVSPKQRRIFVERDTVMFMHTIHTCKHCGICYKKCPKKDSALCVDENGVYYIDKDKCIGCGVCVKACPFEPKRIQMDLTEPRPKAVKCDLCRTRPEGPACIEYCQVKCLGMSDEPIPEPEKVERSGLF